MSSFLIIPVTLGLTVVVQGVLNRRIGADWGMPAAVLLNALIFFAVSLALYGWAKFSPESTPSLLRLPENHVRSMELWYLIPGLCGFILVLGMPISLHQNGPTKTFILLIASQIIFSLGLEKFITGEFPGILKISGALLAVIGATLVALG